MVNDISSNKSQSLYIKVANVPGLYRHAKSERYYAAKKINGKRRERSLGTTDRSRAGNPAASPWRTSQRRVPAHQRVTAQELGDLRA